MNKTLKMDSLQFTAPEFVDAENARMPADFQEGNAQPRLLHYPLQGGSEGARPSIIVCPGGGYQGLAPHEGGPVAQAFNALGFEAFVLMYTLPPENPLSPLQQLAHSVRFVRKNAERFGVNPNQIAICGFSAGGHLCGSAGVHWKQADAIAGDSVSSRPDAMVLCYPVISSIDGSVHSGSLNNLMGKNADAEAQRWFSLEQNVNADTSPTFLWHTADDAAVPVSNSLRFAAALGAANVVYSLHVYPHGRHGLGLAPEDPDLAEWPRLAAQWMQLHVFKNGGKAPRG